MAFPELTNNGITVARALVELGSSGTYNFITLISGLIVNFVNLALLGATVTQPVWFVTLGAVEVAVDAVGVEVEVVTAIGCPANSCVHVEVGILRALDHDAILDELIEPLVDFARGLVSS